MRKIVLFAVIALLLPALCFGQMPDRAGKNTLRPNSLFSDNMVLQAGEDVPVWGTAGNNEKVTVRFNDQEVSTVAKNGKWMVRLKPMHYVTKPATMTVSSADTTIHIRNILVGEVWLCSGQSNMERQLGPRPPQPLIDHWKKERDAAHYPEIREFYVPERYAPKKITDVHGKWTVCSPKTVSNFSAVGYFFGRDLFQKLKVPVGIVFSAFGGTPAEDWTSRKALLSDPALRNLVKNYNKGTGWKPKGKCMDGLYNGMIYPLIPLSIKGVAWYQGESNNNDPVLYKDILSNMIKDWRRDFGEGDLPFLIVQITPQKYMPPQLRESQFLVYKELKNTALIVTTDVGDVHIHSPHKQPVGKRLMLAALALAYGQKIQYSGPVYQSYTVRGHEIILHFTHTNGKLMSKGGKLTGFTIAGANKKFVPVEARIKGTGVVVYSKKIKKPVAVRYGWANVPVCNLFNSAGLPASPFRTDVRR